MPSTSSDGQPEEESRLNVSIPSFFSFFSTSLLLPALHVRRIWSYLSVSLRQNRIKLLFISNCNRTEWSTIQGVIEQVISRTRTIWIREPEVPLPISIITLMIIENSALWLARSFASSRFSIITLMIIESRTLWLARSFALSRYNQRAASSFQNGSQIFWCFGVGNLSIILFSGIVFNVLFVKSKSRHANAQLKSSAIIKTLETGVLLLAVLRLSVNPIKTLLCFGLLTTGERPVKCLYGGRWGGYFSE